MTTEIFNGIAPRYDMTNAVLSWGMDGGWRTRMLSFLPRTATLNVLDLATGTADVAICLARDARVARVTGIDPAEGMLEVGRRKVNAAGLSSKVALHQGDAMRLDFPDGNFDVLTTAFGVRNFPDLMQGLTEAYRVIRPGGHFIVLEFAAPSGGWQKYFHGFYLKFLVPALGMIFTGKTSAYRYLSSSVAAFPFGGRFVRILRQVGFQEVEYQSLAWGAAMIYAGRKAPAYGETLRGAGV